MHLVGVVDVGMGELLEVGIAGGELLDDGRVVDAGAPAEPGDVLRAGSPVRAGAERCRWPSTRRAWPRGTRGLTVGGPAAQDVPRPQGGNDRLRWLSPAGAAARGWPGGGRQSG